jgi:hypothetical protein
VGFNPCKRETPQAEASATQAPQHIAVYNRMAKT